MSLPSFQLLRPKTLDEAVALLAKHDGEVKIVAGGTDLLPSMKQKLFTPPYVLDLRGVDALDAGVRIRRMQDLADQHAGEFEVVRVFAGAGGLAGGVNHCDRFADDGKVAHK